jgi:hypothetical protein
MKRVFISYRRDDTTAMAGRLYDSLSARFGQKNVFFDVSTLGGGIPFKEEIETCLTGTGVLLAVIGSRWLEILQQRGLDPNAADFVAIEIQTAISNEIRVIPVLVGPKANEQFRQFSHSSSPLAVSLAALQKIDVDEGKGYRHQVDDLIRDVEKILGIPRARRLRKIAFGLVCVSIFALGYGVAQSVFNMRYGELPQDAVAVGLRSIEDRNNASRAVPPEVLFRNAEHEVFISGISCYRTFDQQKAPIDEIVARGVQVNVLIMDPDSEDVARLSQALNKPIANDIKTVLEIIHADPKFNGMLHVRLMPRLPPYSAIMVDGNIGSKAVPFPKSILRVQQYLSQNDEHSAIILEFHNDPSARLNGLEFFASDLRKQWESARAAYGAATSRKSD